jgi:hypothetical protein
MKYEDFINVLADGRFFAICKEILSALRQQAKEDPNLDVNEMASRSFEELATKINPDYGDVKEIVHENLKNHLDQWMNDSATLFRQALGSICNSTDDDPRIIVPTLLSKAQQPRSPLRLKDVSETSMEPHSIVASTCVDEMPDMPNLPDMTEGTFVDGESRDPPMTDEGPCDFHTTNDTTLPIVDVPTSLAPFILPTTSEATSDEESQVESLVEDYSSPSPPQSSPIVMEVESSKLSISIDDMHQDIEITANLTDLVTESATDARSDDIFEGDEFHDLETFSDSLESVTNHEISHPMACSHDREDFVVVEGIEDRNVDPSLLGPAIHSFCSGETEVHVHSHDIAEYCTLTTPIPSIEAEEIKANAVVEVLSSEEDTEQVPETKSEDDFVDSSTQGDANVESNAHLEETESDVDILAASQSLVPPSIEESQSSSNDATEQCLVAIEEEEDHPSKNEDSHESDDIQSLEEELSHSMSEKDVTMTEKASEQADDIPDSECRDENATIDEVLGLDSNEIPDIPQLDVNADEAGQEENLPSCTALSDISEDVSNHRAIDPSPCSRDLVDVVHMGKQTNRVSCRKENTQRIAISMNFL